VSAGASFTIALANPSGAQYWSISCTSTDELNTAAAVNTTLVVNQSTKTATCTAPVGTGSALIFTSTVGVLGVGTDANKTRQQAFTTTFKVNVLTGAGSAVLAANELSEQNAAFGWISLINALIRGTAISLPTPPGSGTTVLTDTSGVLAWLPGAGGVGSFSLVTITSAASPFTPTANFMVDVDLITTPGAIVINLPALTQGQFVWIKLKDNGSDPSVHSVTINAPATKQLGGFLPAYTPGTLYSSVVLNLSGQVGQSMFYYGDSSGNAGLR
jgi:hypothetical protein